MSRAPTLLTGVAGFIGFSLAKHLLEKGQVVTGVDNLNSYYDPALKNARLEVLQAFPNFSFHKIDLGDRRAVDELFRDGTFRSVVHLAAQAGVRYSLDNPHAYADANLVGFLHVLEGCRFRKIEHLVFASSSSVYGANTRLPFSVHDNVDHPLSLYAATKKSNELMAHAYSHLFDLPVTGLRFFTVYGPWGRPDMAMFIFTKAIEEGLPLKLFNYGQMRRDFTYIDDVIEAVDRLIDKPPIRRSTMLVPELDPATSAAPWKIYNIGNNRACEISDVVRILESEIGRKAKIELLPIQPGDVPETCADIDDLLRDIGFRPSTSIEEGIREFVLWYREYQSQPTALPHF
ncbi:MAG TPA: NAD-dependent epimerase [Xanthobacteraceae bacterium]|nr:NAD-dependent epimerase [Xanthobacteraceae bacterium]